MMKHYATAAALAGALTLLPAAAADEIISKPLPTGDEKRVDNPVDIWMTAHSGAAGEPVAGGYQNKRFELLDTTDVKQGGFSVRFTATKADAAQAFGFYSGEYIDYWAPGEDFKLHFWLKARAETIPERWVLALYDSAGNRAAKDLDIQVSAPESSTSTRTPHSSFSWREFMVSSNEFQADAEFQFNAIRAIQIEAALSEGAHIWFDDLYFRHKDGMLGKTEILGLTDKTVTQHMAEAAATRMVRREEALSNRRWSPCGDFIFRLYNGTDLEKTNREIIEMAQTLHEGNPWGLWTGSALNWLLFGFSSKGQIMPGRLSAEAEAKLLEVYWDNCRLKNDIASARRSTWYVAGSENHDINLKMKNLLSSQIFMHRPEYSDRVYPDLGRMIGYGYAPNAQVPGYGVTEKLGSGNFKDGMNYTAEDHYQAWVKFWKEWFVERVRHGFFIEHNASGYMFHTNRFLHDIYAWCEDEDLRRQARMFIDLVWAQWAQDQIALMSGGAATRGHPGWYRMSEMAESLLGGPFKNRLAFFYLFSDYAWPREVWEMILGRPDMGEYAYVSRKPNEAQNVWPRPPGTEYSMLIRPDSRIKRYSWVTSDYVMGMRLDHPDALYCHLFGSREGLVFSTGEVIEFRAGGYAVQDRGAAMFMPRKNARMRSPAWFPNYTLSSSPITVAFPAGLDRVVEKNGWVFVEEGNAYVAFRLVAADPESVKNPQGVSKDGFTLLKPDPEAWTLTKNDKGGWKLSAAETYTPMIVEASRREHHATLEAFQEDILDNPVNLKQTMGSAFILTYRGCGDEAKELYLNNGSQEYPKIGGKYVDYNCPAFDSPYLQGDFGSGVVTLTGPVSGDKLVLDFNKIERRSE